jgi:DNA-binding PucR family transcriptional regulator
MDSNQNAKTTATRMGIHVNTVRQRLSSIEEMLGYWGNPTRALEIHVALRLWHLT